MASNGSAHDSGGVERDGRAGSKDRERDRGDDRKSDRRDRDRGEDRGRGGDRRERSRDRRESRGDRDRSRSRDRGDRSRRDKSRSRDRRDRDRGRDYDRPRSRERSRSRDRASYRSTESSARAPPNQEPAKPQPHPGLDPNWRPPAQIAAQIASSVASEGGTSSGSSGIVNAALIQQLQMQLKAQTPAQLKQRQTAKRLYVGNLPIGLPNIEMILSDFVNQTMIAANLHDYTLPGVPVSSVWLSAQQTFGFVEFRSEHECSNGMNLNGVMFSGRQIRVSRPADYIDPNTGVGAAPGVPPGVPLMGGQPLNAASLAAAAAMNPLLAVQLQQVGGIGAVAGMGGAGGVPLGMGIVPVEQAPTPIIMLTNMVTISDLENPKDVQEIKEDTIEECTKFGQVVACIIPRPHPPNEPATPADEHIGKIFVAFNNAASASIAKENLHGRKFDGKSVVAKFFLPEELAKLDASYVPPTSAAPDAASSAAAPDAASAGAASTSAAPDEASAAPEAAAAEGGEGGAGIGVDGAGDASVQEATFFEKGPAA